MVVAGMEQFMKAKCNPRLAFALGGAFFVAFVFPFACPGDDMSIVHDQIIPGMGRVQTIDIKFPGLNSHLFFTEQPTVFTAQMVVDSYRNGEKHATPNVSDLQAWLLRADGTSIPQSGKPDVIGISNAGYTDESLVFTFQKKSKNEVAGVVLSKGGKLYCRAIAIN
jgi:hypothetical protein